MYNSTFIHNIANIGSCITMQYNASDGNAKHAPELKIHKFQKRQINIFKNIPSIVIKKDFMVFYLNHLEIFKIGALKISNQYL